MDAVETGLQALKKVQANQYNAVLMNVQMPEMDGFEATKHIREWEQERGTHIPIIAMTAHAMLGDRERCLEAGMHDYITKPMEPKVLFSALDRWTQAPGPDLRAETVETISSPKLKAGEGRNIYFLINWLMVRIPPGGHKITFFFQ